MADNTRMKSLEANLKSNDLKFAELNEKQDEFKEKQNELQVEMEDIRRILISLSKNMEYILKLQENEVQTNKVAASTSIDVESKDVRTPSSGDGVLGPPPGVVNRNGQADGNNLGDSAEEVIDNHTQSEELNEIEEPEGNKE
ncbi:hypothetical protein FRX31_017097 [Thalictrum thalictroides]|uniref:Uncharacterized protein n=1 Tax=Thalictrum thalictroides TaxID=46969 RepID=A0A7J6W7C9_THATH|nr:hypothetical protein FRX31_017097 [Thalictrum thalictroides]